MEHSEFGEAYGDDHGQRTVAEQRLGEAILGAPIRALEPQPAVSVRGSATIREAIAAMLDHGIGAILVVDGAGQTLGIFTERDVLRRVVLSEVSLDRSVAEVMTADPETLEPGDAIAFALNRMILGGFRHVPIVADDQSPLAVLSLREVVAFIVSLLPAQVHNLPPEPRLEARSADGG